MAKKVTYDIKGKINGLESESFNMTSSWKCKKSGSKYVYEMKPTEDKVIVSFTYWMPSGAKIKSANLLFKKNNPESGISSLTINKKQVKKTTTAAVTIMSTSGTANVEVVFRANGSKKDINQHDATLVLSNVKLRIVYEEPAVMGLGNSELYNKTQNAFPVPPQGVCLYRQDTETIYYFDGVTKVQHDISSKFEEEPDSHKSEYTNGARNEPDKVKIEVVMSDVYTTINNITKAVTRDDDQKTAMDAAAKALGFGAEMDSRSAAAFAQLYTLKTDRPKITVITPQYIYIDMILGSVSVTWDESTPCGWAGQLEFQHYYKTSTSTSKTSSTDEEKCLDPEASTARKNAGKSIIPTGG